MPELDPDFADQIEALIAEAIDAGIVDDVEIVSGYRTTEEQQRLFADWQAGRSRLPAAKPGTSYHEYGLAVDVAVSPPGALSAFGQFAESRGLRWGGRFADPVHIDAGSDLTIQQARASFKASDLVEVA